MTKAELYQKACMLPLLPGVYIIRDKSDTIIYIGKAKRLRIRVSQYFREGVPHDNKVSQMIAHAYAFDVIVCQSEFEALVLEASQIKAHTPKYNILLKDDKDIPEGKVKDYLLASAACFPALRAHTIDGVSYLDGGYRDNMPTALAQKMGAEELVCVDLEGVGITRPNRTGLPTTLIRSYWELGDILHFEPATARRNIELGYHDTLRAFGRLRGCAYAVDSGAESSAIIITQCIQSLGNFFAGKARRK